MVAVAFPHGINLLIHMLLVAVAIAMVIASTPCSAETVTFGNEVSGVAPSNFDSWGIEVTGPGRWAVVLDEGAQDGRAFEQFSSEPIDQRSALAIYKPFSVKITCL
jgi:hypothetical protein